MSTLAKRLQHLGLLMLALTVLAAPAATTAFAEDDGVTTEEQEVRCFQNLRDCYYDSARERGLLDRTVHALDCELSFVDCARRAFGR